jgi:hypothetical protein
MTLKVVSCAVLTALCMQTGGAAAVAAAVAAPAPEHRATDEAREVAFLIHQGTADSLATASLLAHLIDGDDSKQKPDSALLMRRAVALAPQRPELNWLLLRDCELRHCAEENDLVARLHAVDPGNGVVLAPALNVSRAGPPEETTRLIAQMGTAKYISVYWNKLTVSMFDALTHGPKAAPATALTHDADDRLSHVVGVLTAIDTTPFKPIMAVCASDELAVEGRRAACESLMTRLDASDSLIAQS